MGREFFSQEAAEVARALVGAVLVRRVDGVALRARIVETEAYVGVHDLACHASKGKTKRTAIMFGEAGHAYVYFCYGMHHLLNVVTGKIGDAQAVLIRAAEPIGFNANLSGPGNLTKGLRITVADNGTDVVKNNDLFFERGDKRTVNVDVSKRIGVDYAGAWKDAMLRFTDAESTAVSGRKKKGTSTNGGSFTFPP
ncbi:MAG: DNA-3-methyladenine glycosylase [Phycisphaerales bacterium]|nr:DNA-3-methyladenine glycosylase [Phycisphaerales bacterium]